MTDLEERLHTLADAVDVPPVSPYDDLLRGRRRRRRRQWAATGGTALASAAVVVAVWGAVGGTSSEKVGPADRTVPPTQVEDDLRRDLDARQSELADEAAAWNDRMLDVGLQYFNDAPYSIITGGASTLTGATVKAQAAFRGTVEGEVWWQAELLTTAPDVCRAGFECQDRVIDGTPLTFRFVRGGEHDGWAWIEHDGAVVRSRVLMEPSRAEGVAWPIPLERVASFLAHPFWQDLPASQSIPIS